MSQVLAMLSDQELEQIAAEATVENGFGVLSSSRGPFPLQELHVKAAIDGLSASVVVQQTFVNVFAEPLEATYIFPLPDRAAVSGFEMEVAGRRIEGVLRERSEARREYEQAIRSGYRAAIHEEERPDVFSLRVGNLLPQETAVVRFRMVMPLELRDGEATFRFPLVVAPRYIPGRPLPGANVGSGTAQDTDAVPDASRITPPVLLPGFPEPVRLSLSVDIDSGGLSLRDLRSSLHSVCVDNASESGKVRIELRPGELIDRDFILRFRLGDQSLRTSLFLHPDSPNAQQGTFTLVLLPPAENAPTPHRPRDIVFLLDRSGSMDGWKMRAACHALGNMVLSLNDADRFIIFAFDNVVELPYGLSNKNLKLMHANLPWRCICYAWLLAAITARGGTELYQPLDQAVALLASSPADRDRVLVLVTDGQVGNEAEILRMLGSRLQGLRIFTLGIDQAVNAGFLKRLAILVGGTCELVESEQRLWEAMDIIERQLAPPLLTELRLDGQGLQLDTASITPHHLPGLFGGLPLVISGRYQGSGTGSIVVRARDAAGQPWQVTVHGTITDNPAHVKLWARHRLRDLEDLYDSEQGSPEKLERQLVQTSLRYGVLCRFTAYVAVDHSEKVQTGGQLRQFVQPVDLPSGWESLSEAPQPPSAASGPVSARLYSTPPVGAADAHLSLSFCASGASIRPHVTLQRSYSAPGKTVPAPQKPEHRLDHFRRRCHELLQWLKEHRREDETEQRTVLNSLAQRLCELLRSKVARGLGFETLQPLVALLQRLAELTTDAAADAAAVRSCWSEAERVLDEVAGGDEHQRFWKKRPRRQS